MPYMGLLGLLPGLAFSTTPAHEAVLAEFAAALGYSHCTYAEGSSGSAHLPRILVSNGLAPWVASISLHNGGGGRGSRHDSTQPPTCPPPLRLMVPFPPAPRPASMQAPSYLAALLLLLPWPVLRHPPLGPMPVSKVLAPKVRFARAPKLDFAPPTPSSEPPCRKDSIAASHASIRGRGAELWPETCPPTNPGSTQPGLLGWGCLAAPLLASTAAALPSAAITCPASAVEKACAKRGMLCPRWPKLGSRRHGNLLAGSQHRLAARCVPISTARRAGACGCWSGAPPAWHLQEESSSGSARARAGMPDRHCKMLAGQARHVMTTPGSLPCHQQHGSQIHARLPQRNPAYTYFRYIEKRAGHSTASAGWARLGVEHS